MELVALKSDFPEDHTFVCKRGCASFEMRVIPEHSPDSDGTGCLVIFTANLQGWTRWNWPIRWLASVPLTFWELRLHRDAEAILTQHGAVNALDYICQNPEKSDESD
jgi:hypothetical protein